MLYYMLCDLQTFDVCIVYSIPYSRRGIAGAVHKALWPAHGDFSVQFSRVLARWTMSDCLCPQRTTAGHRRRSAEEKGAQS